MSNRIRRVVLVVAVTAGSLSGVISAMGAGAAQPGETFGKIPPNAVQPDGSLDLSAVPNFIETLDQQGKVVGYVRKEDLMPTASTGDLLLPSSRLTVYARDGATVVGEMVRGFGFVAAGSSLSEEAPSVTVRSESS